MLKGTPFHPRTSTLCEAQNWRRWSGYLVAGSYELSHEREYSAIRSSASLIDLSPLYKYHISGSDATRLLDRVVTRHVAKCKVGQVIYTPWCDENGKVIDDGTISRLDENFYRLTSADPSLRWLQENSFGMDVEIEDKTEQICVLGLQGPLARAILVEAGIDGLENLKYYRLGSKSIAGIPVTISRTGYTGDLGYEIWIPSDRALEVWDTLIDAGHGYQITPTGMLALDIARIEAGLMMIEVDYVSAQKALIESRKSSPYELSLAWTVSLDKPFFNGKKALVEEKSLGSSWGFVGIEIEWDSLERVYADYGLPPQLPSTAWRTSVPIYTGGGQVGYASSGCWSPLLKKYIALAHVQSAYAQPGTPVMMEVTVEHIRKRAAGTVVKLPFFNPERKRS